jgi:hypothetical protein
MAAQEFRVQEESRRDQLIAIGSSLFFLVVIVVGLVTQAQFRTLLTCAVAVAASIFFVWTLMREAQTILDRKNWPVVIDEQGIRYASPGQIAWTEIVGLEPVPARQRVDLHDAEGRVRVSLPYDLEDANEVVQFVADMLADRWPKVALPHDFAHDVPRWLQVAGGAAVAVLAGVALLMRDRPAVRVLAVIAIVLFVAAFALWRLRSVRRLTVGKNDLVVVKGIRRRLFNYADIEAVGLFVSGGKAERHLDVKLTFRDQSAAYILPERCDPFDVYAIVKGAWERGRNAAASAIPAAAR